MKLTKEECIDAFNSIVKCTQERNCLNCEYYSNRRCLNGNKDFDILKQLIKERFDNPPLKFEELEEGMWVWVYKESAYIKILCTQTLSGVQFVIIDMLDKTERVIRFKSTELYAREVKE